MLLLGILYCPRMLLQKIKTVCYAATFIDKGNVLKSYSGVAESPLLSIHKGIKKRLAQSILFDYQLRHVL